MKPILNQSSLLWVIGVLQPVSPDEITSYLNKGIEDLDDPLDSSTIHTFCLRQMNKGRLLRVASDPDLFSLTAKGNSVLPKKHRHARDKARLYLLKDTRKNRMRVSRGESAIESDGVSPSSDTRLTTKGGEANMFGLVVPRVQTYWPRPSQQLLNETGLSQSSRDTPLLSMLSFADHKQLALASGIEPEKLELDFHTIGLILGISPLLILHIVHNPSRHYRSFSLKKRGGGERIIDSPRTFLKVIQQFLSDYYLGALKVHNCVESFRLEHSIKHISPLHTFVFGVCQGSMLEHPKKYIKKLFARAILGTVHFMGWKTLSFSRSLLLWAATALFLYYFGGLDELDKKIRIALSTLCGAGILVIIVFLVNLFLAPIRIDKEQEDKISELDKQISNAKITEEKIAGLMKFRERLIKEVFAAESFNDDIPEKNKLLNDIIADAVKYMENYHLSEKYIGLLRTLGTIDPYSHPTEGIRNMAKKAAEVIEKITSSYNGE